jgi:iron uptake system EfeUOB component EfeO/EfeM
VIRKGAAVAAGVSAAIASLAGCSGSATSTTAAANKAAAVVIAPSACAPGWAAPRSGRHLLTVSNQTPAPYSVDLLGADQVTIYGEIELIAPSTSATMDVLIPPGRYSLKCESLSGASTFSSVETVSGPPVSGAHPYVPVDYDQIQLATLTYRSELTGRLKQLAADTDSLEAALKSGDLARARQLWLPAHLDYERLGAAYDTFGNFGDEIDGRPDGLPGGVNDPDFQGFLRLEYGLWHSQPAGELEQVGARLDGAVHGLVKAFPQMQTPDNDLSLRTHEILENTLQFELTGDVDEGSHTTLATALANVQGTQLALGAIASLLRQRQPELLAQASSGLTSLAAMLRGYDRPTGWTPLDNLTQSEREHLDAAVSGLLEQLSPIPDVLELPVQPDTADN